VCSCSWEEEVWRIDFNGSEPSVKAVDENGWTYAVDFNYLAFPFSTGGGIVRMNQVRVCAWLFLFGGFLMCAQCVSSAHQDSCWLPVKHVFPVFPRQALGQLIFILHLGPCLFNWLIHQSVSCTLCEQVAYLKQLKQARRLLFDNWNTCVLNVDAQAQAGCILMLCRCLKISTCCLV